MIKFEKEDLLKLAKLSALKLDENESEILVDQLKNILNYTKELDQIKIEKKVSKTKNVNLFRKDVIKPFNSKEILKQAPKSTNGYFVVPKIK